MGHFKYKNIYRTSWIFIRSCLPVGTIIESMFMVLLSSSLDSDSSIDLSQIIKLIKKAKNRFYLNRGY